MAEELPQNRRLAAIMFTDMVGYSALTQKNEALALDLLNEHRALLRKVFAQHDGREIEAVGDGFFVEFPSALAGARCAVDIQRTLHDRSISAPPERRIEVRVGLHHCIFDRGCLLGPREPPWPLPRRGVPLA